VRVMKTTADKGCDIAEKSRVRRLASDDVMGLNDVKLAMTSYYTTRATTRPECLRLYKRPKNSARVFID
jgi:hypothetical protein